MFVHSVFKEPFAVSLLILFWSCCMVRSIITNYMGMVADTLQNLFHNPYRKVSCVIRRCLCIILWKHRHIDSPHFFAPLRAGSVFNIISKEPAGC